MFPQLHARVLEEVQDVEPKVWWKKTDTNAGSLQDYSTNAIGTFVCTNSSCEQSSWGSKQVAIRVRSYIGNGYNAVVYNQRYKSCKSLGSLTLDENSYVERVAYRIKKWAGVHAERAEYREKKGEPHKSDLCEGCKRGLCDRGN